MAIHAPTKAELEEAVRTGACLGRSEFRGADFRCAQFPNIDLRGSTLEGADFEGATVSGGCFRQAKMRGVILRNAVCRNVGMREADLRDADLRGADLRNALMQDARLEGARWEGAQLAGALLGSASVTEGALAGARVGDFVLVGQRPMLTVGPLGPDRQFVTVWLTNGGCKVDRAGEIVSLEAVRAGLGGVSERDRLEYEAVLSLAASHASIWS